jgi:hypothetical protein
VTRERLAAMIAVVDEEGNGQISCGEWEKAIKSYLDQKKKPRKMSLSDISIGGSLRDRLGGNLDVINEDIGTDSDEEGNSDRLGGNLYVGNEDIFTDIEEPNSDDWKDPFPIQFKALIISSDVDDMA